MLPIKVTRKGGGFLLGLLRWTVPVSVDAGRRASQRSGLSWSLVFLGELTRRRPPLKTRNGVAGNVDASADVDSGEPALSPPPPRRDRLDAHRRQPGIDRDEIAGAGLAVT
jgi:hypothetical protein